MARAPNSKIDQAYTLFIQGEKLVDIAKKIDVPPGTVRRWKSTHNWSGERSIMSERSVLKKRKKQDEVLPVALTEKQKNFCVYYVKNFNAVKSYMKAYGVKYESAATLSWRLLKKVEIQKYISYLKQCKLNRELLSEDDLIQKYIDIAFADITDFVDFGTEKAQVFDEDGNSLTYIKNFLRFKESSCVDGGVIGEVKLGRDGAYIKLADRMRALDKLMEITRSGDESAEDKVTAKLEEIFGNKIIKSGAEKKC